MTGSHEVSCKAVRGAISALIDERLTPRGRLRIEEHLRGCPDCLGEVRAQLDLARRIRALPRRGEPAVADLAARVRAVHGAVARGDAGQAAARGGVPRVARPDRLAWWLLLAGLFLLGTVIGAYELGHAHGRATAEQVVPQELAPADPDVLPGIDAGRQSGAAEAPTDDADAEPVREREPVHEPETERVPEGDDRPLRPLRPVDTGPVPADLTGGR